MKKSQSNKGKAMRPTAEALRRMELADGAAGEDAVRSDVLGSYTGTPLEGDMPVQDADDL